MVNTPEDKSKKPAKKASKGVAVKKAGKKSAGGSFKVNTPEDKNGQKGKKGGKKVGIKKKAGKKAKPK